MSDLSLRLRALLDEQFAVAVALLVALALVGGWVTYTAYVDPGTTTEERRVGEWRTGGWFNHSATVTENNDVYPVGTELQNRSVYFTTVAPRLNGTYTFAYTATERGDLNTTVALDLVLREVEEREEGAAVVWGTTERVDRVTRGSLGPGEPVHVPFSLDVESTANRTEAINEQLGNPPGRTEMFLRATVDLHGTVDGRRVTRSKTYALPVSPEGEVYRVEDPGMVAERYERTRTVAVPRTYGPVHRIGGPVLLGLALLGLAELGAARHRSRLGLSAAERETLAYEDDRETFDEWITTIRLPDDAFDLPRAEAKSLGSLVDFAIDTDRAVVEDPERGAYYVVHDGYLYTYRPSASGHRSVVRPDVEGDDDGTPTDLESDAPDAASNRGDGEPA